jgi:hypothetical protein
VTVARGGHLTRDLTRIGACEVDDEMAAAYERDYADQNRMRVLRDAINDFCVRSPPPRRASAATLEALASAAAELEQDMARIVRTWD